jgi:hypothetical protein
MLFTTSINVDRNCEMLAFLNKYKLKSDLHYLVTQIQKGLDTGYVDVRGYFNEFNTYLHTTYLERNFDQDFNKLWDNFPHPHHDQLLRALEEHETQENHEAIRGEC